MKNAYEGADEIRVNAPSDKVWSILEDSSCLTRWAPMVKATTGKRETAGSRRSCEVEWEGRKDRVVERCLEADPPRRISWVMEEGMMTKMFSTIRFGFDLAPVDGRATALRLWFLYEPRHLLARLMWRFMMKEKMGVMRRTLLGNLKRLAEEG